MQKIRATVTINGGPVNVWANMGLVANPFPAIPMAEYAEANRLLQRLDSDPIRSVKALRTILEGCSPEFIEGCVQRYRRGKRVRFVIEWPRYSV